MYLNKISPNIRQRIIVSIEDEVNECFGEDWLYAN